MYRLHILIHTVQMQIVSGTHYYDKRSFQCRHDYNNVLKYSPTAKSRQKACISLQTEFIPTLEQIRTRLQHFQVTFYQTSRTLHFDLLFAASKETSLHIRTFP